MQRPSDPHAHAHPDHHSHPNPNPAAGARAGTPHAASLFLAGSRERLMVASGVVAVLWCLVWWALD